MAGKGLEKHGERFVNHFPLAWENNVLVVVGPDDSPEIPAVDRNGERDGEVSELTCSFEQNQASSVPAWSSTKRAVGSARSYPMPSKYLPRGG